MSASSDNAIKELEGAERTLSSLDALSSQQAGRVAERMDRLASQLLEVGEPVPMAGVQERLGTTPVGPEEFEAFAHGMAPRDGEG